MASVTTEPNDLRAKVAELEAELAGLRATTISKDEMATTYARYIADADRNNQELERFAYAVSHDLQEPLRGVSWYLGLLQDEFGPFSGNQKVYVDGALAGAVKARRMVDGLLSYARANKNSTFERINLDDVVADALDLVRDPTKCPVTIEKTELGVAWGDESAIGRVYQNLISNAMKFRRQDTDLVIRIHGSVVDGEWNLSVSDNGTGFDMRFAGRVFNLFQRLSPEVEGTGIGLAVVKKIVERHGGRIWIESQQGVGTTVSFTLPTNHEMA